MVQRTQFVNIRDTVPLIAPQEVRDEQPASEHDYQFVVESREAVKRILNGEDDRLLVVVGPCSIHDQTACLEYARRLHKLSEKVKDRMLVVMRVYFEKPRTTVGWKGLINDPHVNDTFDIATGLRIARRILLEVTRIGLPATTEMLETITPLYISDLITLASIGARTTESPLHRQMASGLSMPVGYKNGTDGSFEGAINAMRSAQHPHSFLGINDEGKTCVVHTTGNPWPYLILRGGRSGPNYSAEDIRDAIAQLNDAGLPPRVVVDCSHANSDKDYRNQSVVWQDVIEQRLNGNGGITGLMLESNLYPGNQRPSRDLSKLEFGVSITDACIGWDETEEMILGAYEQLAPGQAVGSSASRTA